MTDISILAPFVDDDPDNYAELVSSCGKLIDAWLAAGGEPTDDPVIGFYGIWSQSLDVPLDARPRLEDETDFYRFFYETFIEKRDGLRELMGKTQDRT
jgi:hypothetical protein